MFVSLRLGILGGPGNGLLPESFKLLPEPMLINDEVRYCAIHPREISQEMLLISILDMNLKMINFIIQLHNPGANELNSLSL